MHVSGLYSFDYVKFIQYFNMWKVSSHYASFPKLPCVFLHIFLYDLYEFSFLAPPNSVNILNICDIIILYVHTNEGIIGSYDFKSSNPNQSNLRIYFDYPLIQFLWGIIAGSFKVLLFVGFFPYKL